MLARAAAHRETIRSAGLRRLLTGPMSEQMLDGENVAACLSQMGGQEEPYAFHPHSFMFQLLTSVLLLGL